MIVLQSVLVTHLCHLYTTQSPYSTVHMYGTYFYFIDIAYRRIKAYRVSHIIPFNPNNWATVCCTTSGKLKITNEG